MSNSAGAQHHQRTGRREKLASCRVKTPAGELVDRVSARRCTRSGSRGTAQHRPDTGEQFARAEGFGQVVVGADFEAEDAVGLTADRGQHDNRHPAASAQLPAQRETVLAGQHDVENDKIDLGAGQALHHRAAVGGDRDAKAVLREEV
jgi:hypothetical protein